MMNVLSWIVTAIVSLTTSWSMSAQTPASVISRADAQFCQAVADRDLEKFLAFVAADATFDGGPAGQIHGRSAVQKAWAPYFRLGGPTLTWEPARSEVLPGGDVGYTSGRWTRTSTAPDGRAIVGRGHYLTVWRRQTDGAWRVIYDTGSDDPPERR